MIPVVESDRSVVGHRFRQAVHRSHPATNLHPGFWPYIILSIVLYVRGYLNATVFGPRDSARRFEWNRNWDVRGDSEGPLPRKADLLSLSFYRPDASHKCALLRLQFEDLCEGALSKPIYGPDLQPIGVKTVLQLVDPLREVCH